MSIPRIPALTAEQRRAALERATSVRKARRAFKDEVGRGTQGIAAVIALAKADQDLAGIKVYDLLTSLQGVGPKRAAGLIEDVGIAASRRVRGLGEHQIAALIARLSP